MYKNNQLWNRYFPRSQRISYWYKETPWCPGIYIIDLNQFLLLFLLTIIKQKYFSSSPKLLFNYIVFEFTLLLVVRHRYSENYITTISCTWEWTSSGWVLTLIEQRLAKIKVMGFGLVSTDLLVVGCWFNDGFMLFTVVKLYGLGFDFGGCWLNGFWLLLLIMAWWWWLRFSGWVDLDFNGGW